jgi:DNA-binding response OmpR family regulator
MSETILVVEDEPALHETLACKLKSAGYALMTAADARTAVEAACQLKPDLVILDVMLPGSSGHSARQPCSLSVCPVNHLTGHYSAATRAMKSHS